MTILHVVASYWPAVRYGGTIVSVHGLCKALAARGHDVHVFTTSVDGGSDSDVPHGVPVDVEGVKVWYFRSTRLRRVYYAPALKQVLRAHIREFDLVHTHAIYLWPLWAAARAAQRAGVPYVVSLRGMLEKDLIARKSSLSKAALIGFVERANLERASAIHVTSAREAAEAAAFGFNLPRLIEIPNGVDLDGDELGEEAVSREVAAVIAPGPYVLFLGRLSWKKGLDRLVATVPYFPAGLRLIVAGNDDEGIRPTLEAQGARLGVADRVVYTGAVAGREKRELLANARIVVLPSYSENFGNVVVEAMAAGRAVVVTPEVGVAPLVERAGAGWVVSGDAATLGSHIARLAGDDALRQQMGARGRTMVERELSWNHVAGQMESAYSSLLPPSATLAS